MKTNTKSTKQPFCLCINTQNFANVKFKWLEKLRNLLKGYKGYFKGFFVATCSDAVIFLFLKRDWDFELDKVTKVLVK